MNSRIIYLVCSPLLMITGAATTVIAPMLLDPASFTHFALLTSMFTYLSEFDLGLARLSDRLLPGQAEPEAEAIGGRLLFARYCIAGILLLSLLVLATPLMLLAGAGGVAMLLANGPLSYHRARTNTRFIRASLLLQFGMTLPRLSGLLVDGVRGAIVGLGLWTGLSCVILNWPMLATLRAQAMQLPKVFRQSVPLFLYNATWLLYLFANRWIAWAVSNSEVEAGLFAFGANLTVVGVGLVMTLSQPYYPRHLAEPNPRRLARELYLLLALGAAGVVGGILFCRFLLGTVFHHFAASADVTAALLICAVPLALSAWVVPLVIARADRVGEVMIFPVCLAAMGGLMILLNDHAGIVGQAWGCLPPALLLLATQLAEVTKKGLLIRRSAVTVWMACGAVVMLGALTWWLVFRQ
jgi:hypothetical protein